MGNTLSKIYIDNFQMFEKSKKNNTYYMQKSYNDCMSLYGGVNIEIKTPVEDRFPPQACVIEYKVVICKVLDRLLKGNKRDSLLIR
jgi:hypothetical protein